MRSLTLFTCIVILGYGCSSTSEMSLSVKKPARVTLPANINTVAVINRTEASDATKTLDALHKALSLQTNNLQTTGARASLQGLTDELLKNNRFTEVKQMDNLKLYSFGSGIFPTALSWDSVEKICMETNTNALFSLELFDAESKVAYAATPVNINAGIISIPAIQNNVGMNTKLKTGWRIYDPSTRTILDEYILGSDLVFEGSGINPLVVASALAGRKEVVKDAGYKAGEAYASRILPYWIRVTREYFVRGDDNLIIAQRKAQSGNWDGAAALWKSKTTSSNATLAGRACYNMAIFAEINGDLDGAIQWAQKSYENYGVRLALYYVNILRNRKSQEELLKIQAVTYTK